MAFALYEMKIVLARLLTADLELADAQGAAGEPRVLHRPGRGAADPVPIALTRPA
jgi:hypothetical protein